MNSKQQLRGAELCPNAAHATTGDLIRGQSLPSLAHSAVTGSCGSPIATGPVIGQTLSLPARLFIPRMAFFAIPCEATMTISITMVE